MPHLADSLLARKASINLEACKAAEAIRDTRTAVDFMASCSLQLQAGLASLCNVAGVDLRSWEQQTDTQHRLCMLVQKVVFLVARLRDTPNSLQCTVDRQKNSGARSEKELCSSLNAQLRQKDESIAAHKDEILHRERLLAGYHDEGIRRQEQYRIAVLAIQRLEARPAMA